MSDNEIEDNKNAIVESEVIEAEKVEPEITEPAIPKKGSFLSFLAFIFSLAAVALSGYMYYTQHFLAQSKSTENSWQQAVTQLQAQNKNNTAKVQDLASKMATLKSNNQDLLAQLSSLKKMTPNENTNAQTFDDTALNESINNLQNQLAEQNKQINNINQQQTQALNQFKKRYEQDKSTPSTIIENSIDPIQKQKTITEDLVAAYLLAAHKNLNVSNNVKLATTNLNKAADKLKELSDNKYLSFIEELNKTSSELDANKKVDVFGLNMNIAAIQSSVNKLAIASTQEKAKEQSSWYDGLVKIKKIDDSQQKLLTQSDQAAIRQTLKLHFDLMRSALISQNMGLWVSEIEELSALVKKNFTETQDRLQDAILRQLNELKNNNINPTFPDLSIYLQKFNALLNAQTIGE